MAEIQIKRIYEAACAEDGRRVLVDRLWPRGISKERAALDRWEKDAAPSTDLRKWFGHDPERFQEFSVRYEEELDTSEPAHAFAEWCGGELAQGSNVTLLYAAHDPACNHALVLQAWVQRVLSADSEQKRSASV